MTAVRVRNLRKSFDGVEAVAGIDLDVAEGEFCVLVGPSGCGKSTLLRMIAGLEDINSGELEIDGRRVNDVAPADRGVSMVFQSYALYPHMSVYDNIAFGLKLNKADAGSVDERVREVAAILQLQDLLERKPKALSGGQRQRVAIGRAIARRPRVFLFDEPLSNLDAALRVQMRLEIGRLHRQLGATMIHVTHDQVEAMTMADKIVVLNNGRVEQVGTPRQLYDRPANTFVAAFIGSPAMNLLAARVDGDALCIDGIDRPFAFTGAMTAADGTPVTVGIRPEHWRISDGGDGLSCIVEAVEDQGDLRVLHSIVENDTDGGPTITLRETVTKDVTRRRGDRLIVIAYPDDLHLFDTNGDRMPSDRLTED